MAGAAPLQRFSERAAGLKESQLNRGAARSEAIEPAGAVPAGHLFTLRVWHQSSIGPMLRQSAAIVLAVRSSSA